MAITQLSYRSTASASAKHRRKPHGRPCIGGGTDGTIEDLASRDFWPPFEA